MPPETLIIPETGLFNRKTNSPFKTAITYACFQFTKNKVYITIMLDKPSFIPGTATKRGGIIPSMYERTMDSANNSAVMTSLFICWD